MEKFPRLKAVQPAREIESLSFRSFKGYFLVGFFNLVYPSLRRFEGVAGLFDGIAFYVKGRREELSVGKLDDDVVLVDVLAGSFVF